MHIKALCSTPLLLGRGLTKTLRIMRLTAIILLAGALQVSATGYSQQVTLSLHHASLEKALAEIQSQTGYNVVYAKIELENAHPVDLNVRNARLQDVLDLCFKDQPLAYTIEDRYIVVKRKQASQSIEQTALPPGDIHGRVTDSLGNPLAGASVTVKGTKKGTVTNEKGEFLLKGTTDATLVISFTGYGSREYKWSGNENISIALSRSNSPLDEVQVIAYGTTSERFNTGDITTIKAVDIEKQPVTNPLLALEGRVPGLFITQATGFPGSGVTALIQGQNSISNGNDPYYVIDGVPFVSELLNNLGGIVGASGVNITSFGNPLNFINPADIESITVLKDADATAIYGSRAANGAILITTKKGKAGTKKVDFDLQQGVGKVPHFVNLLNTPQYLAMRHEAKQNDGSPKPSATDYDINGFWDSTRYTNWQKVLIGGTAQYSNFSSTVSGGSANTTYLIGGTYHRETTVFPGDFSDNRGSVHFAINNISPNQRFKIQLTGNYLLDDSKLPNSDLTGVALTLAPDAPAIYNPDGSINWMPKSAGASTWTNPFGTNTRHYNNKTNNLLSNALISYEILKGLEIKSSFGYNNIQSDEVTMIPWTSIRPENRPNTPREGDYSHNNINTWLVEPQLNYKLAVLGGKLEALVGSTIQQTNSNGSQLDGTGYNTDQAIGNILSASTVVALSSTISTYKYNALFGRLNYNLGDKYLLDITARRDGSSRFGSANEFHNFGAVGAGWIFSQEEFLKKNFSWLSFGKLRISYGTTGSDQIGDYQYLNLYNPTYSAVPYEGATGLVPAGIPNPYLQWEETKKMDIGLDLGIFKDRLLINVNYNVNRSSNELLALAYPSTVGVVGTPQNFPAVVQNTSLEGAIHGVVINGRDFGWTTDFNITVPQNKLVSFPNLDSSTEANFLVIGKSINIIRVYHSLGVDPTTGMYLIADKNGKPTATPTFPTDATVIFNRSATLYGGWSNNFRFKGFELGFLFQYVKREGANYFLGNRPGQPSTNQPSVVLDRWQTAGNQATHERFSANSSLSSVFSHASSSDLRYRDASYGRLKNLTLSWQFPEKLIKRSHLTNLRVFFRGQNLFTITKYIGLDPETLSTTSLPILRVYTFGVQLGL
jgi:TonB-linked SusC/RagA family outer membrane protein